MNRVIVLLILALLALSCARLPERAEEGRGDIPYLSMVALDSIPSAWGHLVSVSNSADFGHIFQLWFEDPTGNVRVAFYDMRDNTLQTQGRLFPRSQGVMQ
ncbi:hypothetical protein KDL67_10440 [bacterium]|nr:hypothetical protein [bacterium]